MVFEFTSFSLFWQNIVAASGTMQVIFGVKMLKVINYFLISLSKFELTNENPLLKSSVSLLLEIAQLHTATLFEAFFYSVFL